MLFMTLKLKEEIKIDRNILEKQYKSYNFWYRIGLVWGILGLIDLIAKSFFSAVLITIFGASTIGIFFVFILRLWFVGFLIVFATAGTRRRLFDKLYNISDKIEPPQIK